MIMEAQLNKLFIYVENSLILNSCVCVCVSKLCEPLGISIHLKDKLESSISFSGMTIKCESVSY